MPLADLQYPHTSREPVATDSLVLFFVFFSLINFLNNYFFIGSFSPSDNFQPLHGEIVPRLLYDYLEFVGFQDLSF